MRIAFVVLLVALAAVAVAGCGGASSSGQPSQLIGFGNYIDPHGDFEATRLVKLDPTTLRDEPGRGLKLGDAASSRVLSPDSRTLAIGGTNFGEIVLVGLAHLSRVGTIRVARIAHGEDMQVTVIAWPSAHRLLALLSLAPSVSLVPTRLVVVDPVRRRVVRSFALGGAVASTASARGRAVVLVSTIGKVASARLSSPAKVGRLGVSSSDGSSSGKERKGASTASPAGPDSRSVATARWSSAAKSRSPRST